MSAASNIDADEARRLRFANIRAALALRGFQLHELSDGSMLIARWNLTRPAPDLAAAIAFARSVGCAL